MKKSTLTEACINKEQALEQKINANTDAEKSVGRLKRQQRAIRIVRQLVEQNIEGDDVAMTSDLEDDIMSMLEASRGRSSVVVHEGDTLLELWQRYNNVPDMMKKINSQLEKNGWVINGTTGAVIKA